MNAAPISSQIDKVTVYRQGARVTRVATVTGGGPPPAVVRISGLPLAMDDGSIQARVSSGDGSAELPVAADLHVVLEVPAVDADLPDADDEELDDARREESRLEQVIAAIEVELGRIDRLQIAPRPKPAEGEAPGESPTSARLALVEFRAAREADLSAELRVVQADLDRARRRRERAEDRDQRASTARQAREHELKKSVEITLRAGRDCASAFAIELDYLVPGARWAPAYTVRLDKEMSAAELAMRAVVGQCTGEDWKGVEVTLSTADAQRWNELPELHSRRIGRRQPKPARVGWRPPPTGADELYADYDRSFAELSIGANMPLPPPPQPSAPADYDALVDGFAPAEAREETVMLALDECEAEAGDYAPPAPMMMSPEAAPTMMARAGALGGLLSRSARPAKKEKAKGRKAAAHADNRYQMQSFAAPAPGGYGAGMVEPELDDDADVGASDAQLAYGGLRMPAPHAAERGHLVIATQQEIYLELFVRQQIVVGFDVVAAIDRAGQRARAIESATLPARHQPAWSEDYDYAYVAEDRLDVPSDGEFHSIPMTSSSAAANGRPVSGGRRNGLCTWTSTAGNRVPLIAPSWRAVCQFRSNDPAASSGRSCQ